MAALQIQKDTLVTCQTTAGYSETSAKELGDHVITLNHLKNRTQVQSVPSCPPSSTTTCVSSELQENTPPDEWVMLKKATESLVEQSLITLQKELAKGLRRLASSLDDTLELREKTRKERLAQQELSSKYRLNHTEGLMKRMEKESEEKDLKGLSCKSSSDLPQVCLENREERRREMARSASEWDCDVTAWNIVDSKQDESDSQKWNTELLSMAQTMKQQSQAMKDKMAELWSAMEMNRGETLKTLQEKDSKQSCNLRSLKVLEPFRTPEVKLTADGPPLSSSTVGSVPAAKEALSDLSLDVSAPLRALDDQNVKRSPRSSIQISPPRVAWQQALVRPVLPPIAGRAKEEVKTLDGQSQTYKQISSSKLGSTMPARVKALKKKKRVVKDLQKVVEKSEIQKKNESRVILESVREEAEEDSSQMKGEKQERWFRSKRWRRFIHRLGLSGILS